MLNFAEQLENKRKQRAYRQREIVESPQGVRIRIGDKSYLSFCSNDYLGLANDPAVIQAFHKGVDQYGVGSGAAHLVSGHTRPHHELEIALAQHLGRDRALLFSTGYMANLGVIGALCGRHDVVLEDKLNHASLLDGGRYSGANLRRYAHGNLEQVEKNLQDADGKNVLLVTDGVFSMDGEVAPLAELLTLADRHGASVLVDDAHGIGVLGQRGAGICELNNLMENDRPIVVGTLGKAFGVFGAFVAGSESLIEWLIQEARTYIYTTALPPAVASAALASLRIIQQEPERRQQLEKLIRHFREGIANLGLPLTPSLTPIQPLILGDNALALRVSEQLREQGILVKAIRPPTVPEGTARLRITLSSAHTEEDVTQLIRVLEQSL